MIDTTDHKIQNLLGDYFIRERLEQVNSICNEIDFKDTYYTKYVKRLFDIIISVLALIITLPINLVIGVVTYTTLGRPLFFTQERVGKNGKIIKIIKFRNMTNECDANGDLLPPQQRLTKIGVFLRKTSLDELLNFWSILKGDMSLIGPRALPLTYLSRYSKRHLGRLKMKPGLECPSWCRLDHPRTWNEQFENDVWYVENVSFIVDVLMLVKLIQYTFSHNDSVVRANCQKGSFIGYTCDGKAISNYDLDDKLIQYILELKCI